MPLTLDIAPLKEAVQRLRSKVPVATTLRTRELAKLPLALRERAQFSAAVAKLDTIQDIAAKLDEWVTLGQADPARSLMDRSKFVAEMRASLGAPAGDSGQLTDIASRRRLELIYDFQTQDAMEYGRYAIGHDPDALDAYPAQEFIRVEDRIKERPDWPQRWSAAGGQTYSGRMAALKTDPVWQKLSRFGKPWPPFDFGSGMGVRDLSRDEAEQLGLLAPDAPVTPSVDSFNAHLEASVRNLPADQQAWLQDKFGDQITIQDGTARWTSAP